jgi:hypothetical protein
MSYYLVDIDDRYMGIEQAKDKREARAIARREWGRHVAITVHDVTQEDIRHILSMGGYVPEELKARSD